MARKMKTSGKFILTLISIILIVIILKLTGLWSKLVPEKSVKQTSIPQIDGVASKGVPGTTPLRLAHWTWNSHQAWALANKGEVTKADSIFAKNKVSLQFRRVEEIPLQIAALKRFAAAFDDGEENPTSGVHFFTIMGDAGGWVINDTNKALKEVDSSFEAEIIGFSGFSSGEDKFMGLPSWKADPNNAKGGLVSGVAADGDWNIMIFWCAQNQIPFNADKKYYDPKALNFLETDSYVKAGDVYIAGKPVERIFRSDGKDYQGNPIKKGEKGLVAINGVVTWTPVDKNIADKKGGLVSIVSTKEYSNQMPQFIIGLKQWNMKNKETVINMLASIFEASDLIQNAEKQLKRKKIQPKSAADYRWQAAQYTYELFDSETPDYWYKYYRIITVKDIKGLSVEIGGSSVSNLQRNLQFFGLSGGTDIGEIVYNRFAKLAMHYYPDFMSGYKPWKTVFNPVYLKGVRSAHGSLAKSDPNLPTFTKTVGGNQIGELTFRIPFKGGSATITKKGAKILRKALDELVIAANSRVEIHGHTASPCPQKRCLRVSKERSQAVQRWLKSKAGSSFPVGRVKVVPHGKAQLLAKDYVNGKWLPDKMALNRRVVLKIYTN